MRLDGVVHTRTCNARLVLAMRAWDFAESCMLQQSAHRRAPTMVVPLGPAAGRSKELSAAPVAEVLVEID